MLSKTLKFIIRIMYLGGHGKMRYFFCKLFPSPDCNLLRSSSGIRGNPNKDEAFKKANQWLSALSKDRSLDLEGLPMPSYSVAAMHFLEERLKKDLQVFEFGSGFSSLFYARKCKSVIAIEHDQEWFNEIKSHNTSNLSIFLKDLENEYDKSILGFEQNFDLIIVDGRNRNKCIYNSISKLTQSGVIILDDSHREKYEPGKKFLTGQGFKCLKMFSHASSKMTFTETSFFYRSGNCLDI